MKIFFASLCIFSLMLAALTVNALFVHRTVGQMQTLLDGMDSMGSSVESLRALEALWSDKRNLIALTVGRREIMLIDEQLTELKWASKDGTETEFQKYRALLYSVTEELLRQESLRLDSIF